MFVGIAYIYFLPFIQKLTIDCFYILINQPFNYFWLCSTFIIIIIISIIKPLFNQELKTLEI